MPRIVIILSLLLVGWLGGGSWWWVCQHRGLCDGSPSSQTASSSSGEQNQADQQSPDAPTGIQRTPFVVNYQGNPLFQSPDHILFEKSKANGLIPEKIQAGLDSLAAYMKAHPNQDLEITGAYGEQEANDSDQPNLGLGRANFIRQSLLGRGIPADQLILLPKQSRMAELFGEGDTLFGGIAFRLLDRTNGQLAGAETGATGNESVSENESAAGSNERRAGETGEGVDAENAGEEPTPEPALSFAPKNFLFETAKSDLILSAADRDYISSVIQYLRQNPSRKLLLIGHADNVGTPERNMQFGRNRANTVKQFFTSFGLSATQISTESKGDTAPVQSNDTEEGRRQNRRVEIRISQ